MHRNQCRQCYTVLERIAALNAPLQSALPGSKSAALQLTAACLASARCMLLPTVLDPAAAGPTARLREACILLPLESVRLALEAAAGLTPGTTQLPRSTADLLFFQLEAVAQLLPVPSSGAAAPAAEAKLAAQWIRTAATAVARLPELCLGRSPRGHALLCRDMRPGSHAA